MGMMDCLDDWMISMFRVDMEPVASSDCRYQHYNLKQKMLQLLMMIIRNLKEASINRKYKKRSNDSHRHRLKHG